VNQIFITGHSVEVVGLGLLGGLLLTAVWHDITSHRIPNAIVFWGAALGLLFHMGLTTSSNAADIMPIGLGFLKSLAGLGVGLCALLPLYFLRGAAAGDAKLMAMVGTFLGPIDTFGAVLCTFVVGAVLALVIAVRAGVFEKMLKNVRLILFGTAAKLAGVDGLQFNPRTDTTAKVPYALAIAFGTATWLSLRYFY